MATAPPDPLVAWDALVEQSRRRASMTHSDLGQMVRLSVRPDVSARARRDVRRELGRVPDMVRQTARGLIAGERPWPLYLYGDSGVGKTSLSLLMLDVCGPEGPSSGKRPEKVTEWLCGYCDARWIPGLKIDADKRRLAWSREGAGGETTWEDLLNAARRASLFVVDEIGVGADVADFRLDSILEVIAERCTNPVRPFVVTGNVAPQDLARIYDQRVARRVTWGTVIQWNRGGVTVKARMPSGEFVLANPL